MTVSVTFQSENSIKYSGLAADTKPTPDRKYTVAWFLATDTFERFVWDGDAWVEANIARAKIEVRLNVDAIRTGATPPAEEATESMGASGNIKIPSLAFGVAGGGDEEVFFILHMGKGCDGTVDVQFHLIWKPDQNWSSGDYRWVLEYLVKDASGGDASAGTPTIVNEDTTPANANDIIETEFTGTIDAGPNQLVFCRLSLDKSESGADADGHLLFVETEFTIDKLGELFE